MALPTSSTLTPPSPSDIEYHLISSSNRLHAVDIFTSCFQYEPGSASLHVTKADWSEFGEGYIDKIIEEGMSYVAVDRREGKVIGLVWNVDMFHVPPLKIEETVRGNLIPIFTVCEEIYKKSAFINDYYKDREQKLGDGFYVFCLGVLPEYSNLGISKNLINISLNLAKSLNFKYSRVEASNYYCKLAFEKFGFIAESEIVYKTYCIDGIYPWENKDIELGPHKSMVLLWKYL